MGSVSKAAPLVLSLLFLLVGYGEGHGYAKPPTCKYLECPHYKVLDSQHDYEIRVYKLRTWMSTMVHSSSFREASREGFDHLFAYINGENSKGAKIKMTAPVLINVCPSTGPLGKSTFAMLFYLPRKYQSNPPMSRKVSKKLWPNTKNNCVAVRRFGGTMDDVSVIAMEAEKLIHCLKGTRWEEMVKAAAKARNYGYTVAGYNSPYEYANRVNEVMMEF